MSGVLGWIFIFLLNLIAINCKICKVCKCMFLDVQLVEPENFEIKFNFNPNKVEQYNDSTSYAEFIEKYFYVNCFEESDLDRMGNFQWPQIEVLGIFANFMNSKRQKFQYFPDEIKNQVTVLSLSNNFISDIEISELKEFNNLKLLNLSRNKIEKIRKSTFESTNLLEVLDLSDNKIFEVENWSFYGTFLKYLNLSKNFINHLSADVFRGLNNLIYLDISGNNLTDLWYNFATHTPHLKFLFLQNNELEQIPELPKNLKKLDVSSNKLMEIQLTHSNLEVLNLDKNHLVNLADCNFAKLKVLTISHNNMATLAHLGSKEILILDVSYNQFTEIPEIISSDELPFLRELILNGNLISNITFPRQTRPFESLKKVSCSNCKLKELSRNSFENVFSDKKFNCSSQNGLTLNFSHNMITYVEKEIFKNFQVCSVDLSNNKIKTFSERVLNWNEMSHINLQNNPWQCDCNIQWMLKQFLVFMYNNQPRLLFNLKCATPRRYKNKLFVMWYNKTAEDFCNSSPFNFILDLEAKTKNEIWTASSISCIVLGCFIFCILIAIIILLRKKPNRKIEMRKTKNIKGKSNYKPINNIKNNDVV